MKIVNINKKLEDLKRGIEEIRVDNIVEGDIESILTVYNIKLEMLFNRFTIEDKTLGYIFRFKISGKKVEITIRSKLKDAITYSSNIVLKTENNDFLKIIKYESIKILSNIYKYNLAENYIRRLNSELERITYDCELSLYFKLSDCIVEDISDNYLVIGLSVEQALTIPSSALFDIYNSTLYRERLREQIKICQTPAQLLKYTNEIYRELNVYNRSRLDLTLRRKYTRKYEYLGSTGVGYILTDKFIALVEIKEGVEKLKLSPIDLKTFLYTEDDLMFR